MNKLVIKIFSILSVVLLVLVPCDFAWKWSTHSAILEKTYDTLPSYIKKNLNLNAMKDGSNDPDEKFQDFINHSFPNSYSKAKKWLNKGKLAYNHKNYYYASYCFGIASHYISDSFSAPHSANEISYLHSKYESQARSLNPTMNITNKDLYTSLKQGDLQGEKDWNSWKKTKKTSIIQKDLNAATSATYSAIKNSIN
jgi:hypothetical protein